MYTYWETSGVSVNVNKFYLFSKLGQMCNLGMHHRYNTGISSVYESTLTADKAFNVLYSNYREDCAGTVIKTPGGRLPSSPFQRFSKSA